MRISKLIADLQAAQAKFGDLPVYVQDAGASVYLAKVGGVWIEGEEVEYPASDRSKLYQTSDQKNCIRVDLLT